MPDVQGCQPNQFIDRTSSSADRELDYDFGIGGDPERCLQVQVGQSVFWNGVSDVHPLDGSGGDLPNPISAHNNGTVTFNGVGTFGFFCSNHSTMKGAIKVVAAPRAPATAAPVASPGLTLALTVLLLLGGLGVIAGRAGRASKLLQARR